MQDVTAAHFVDDTAMISTSNDPVISTDEDECASNWLLRMTNNEK